MQLRAVLSPTGLSGSSAPFWASDLMAPRSFERMSIYCGQFASARAGARAKALLRFAATLRVRLPLKPTPL